MQALESCAAWQTYMWHHKDRVTSGRTQAASDTALAAMPDDKHENQGMHDALRTVQSIWLYPVHASLLHASA